MQYMTKTLLVFVLTFAILPTAVPGDPGYLGTWEPLMGLLQSWADQDQFEQNRDPRIRDVVIVTADGWVDCDHPDLKDACLSQLGLNFTDEPLRDTNSHGTTFASGIVAKPFNNISAVSPGGYYSHIKIVPDKVLNSQGFSSSSKLRLVYQHALDLKNQGWNVVAIATSLTGVGDSNTPESLRLIRLMATQGIALICSAGQGGVNLDTAANKLYPAAYGAEPNVITVAGLNEAGDALDPTSAFGPILVEFAAPMRIEVVVSGSNTDTASTAGTSASAAVVAGMFGIISAYRAPNMAKSIRLLENSCTPIPGVRCGRPNEHVALAGQFPIKLQAASLDSVSQKASPLSLASLFGSDHRTRLMLFAENIDASLAKTEVTVKFEDSQGGIFTATPEFVGEISGREWITQSIVRLPNLAAGAVTVTFTARGLSSQTTVTISG